MSENTTINLSIGITGLLIFAFQLYVFVKAVGYPRRAYEEAGHSKTTWVVVLFVAFFLSACGLLLSMWFFISPSVDIKRVLRLGGRPGFPGGM